MNGERDVGLKLSPATEGAWRAHAGRIAGWTVALAAFVLAATACVWGLALAGVLPLGAGLGVQTLLAYAAFTPMHEAVHGNVSGARSRGHPLDAAVGWLSSLILFAPYSAFEVLHLAHHSHTNDGARDPDLWVAGRGPFAVTLRCLAIVPHYLADFFVGPTSQGRAAKAARAGALVHLALQVGVACTLAAVGLGREALYLWVVPAILASGLLALAFDWLPHHPHRVQGRGRDTRVLLGPGLSLMTFGQNLHLVHHLWPRVPFYAYGRVFAAARAELEAAGATIVKLEGRRR